jgi:ATPase subunit of ABC transporter with duplicated ATPase domains
LPRGIAGLADLDGVTVRRGAAVGYLPQQLDILDDSLIVVDNVRAAEPSASVNEVRASLARFLFRGDRADRVAARCPVVSDSARCSPGSCWPSPPLSCYGSASRPTTWTWRRSGSCPKALDGYRGALIAASHDLSFLRSAGITRWLLLDRDTGLTAVEPR